MTSLFYIYIPILLLLSSPFPLAFCHSSCLELDCYRFWEPNKISCSLGSGNTYSYDRAKNTLSPGQLSEVSGKPDQVYLANFYREVDNEIPADAKLFEPFAPV